jgi:hypothetical protein
MSLHLTDRLKNERQTAMQSVLPNDVQWQDDPHGFERAGTILRRALRSVLEECITDRFDSATSLSLDALDAAEQRKNEEEGQ